MSSFAQTSMALGPLLAPPNATTTAAVTTSVPLPALRLNRSNFMLWRTLSLPNLSGAGLHGYLDGTQGSRKRYA
jgi:hypothetical protein